MAVEIQALVLWIELDAVALAGVLVMSSDVMHILSMIELEQQSTNH